MIAPIEKPEGGGGGQLFSREENFRSDARLAARMISLGVVPEAKMQEILTQATHLLAECADKKKIRSYTSLMKTVVEIARLELAAKQYQSDNRPKDRVDSTPAYTRDSLLETLERRSRELPPSN